MFSLTVSERKALLFLGFLLILGAFLKNLPSQRLPSFISEEAVSSSSFKVNINKAKFKDLIKLPYIGEVLAKRIISYREKNGPFQSIEELKKVKGVGEKKLKAIKNFISLN
ncbi:MAG TPA: helix-hairpin-helix domain-containing protein [Candidatus Omnitrophica bacterium]|nr:MAG: hypothetical protein DRP61_03795 [Candidatus Omnitrophota bacterium]RKY35541.1 MAG: hypothetical protein DRP69_01060 [Candidatus Omnitrophota bacterium]RKY44485.1 MAG: hypothetical protein DRP80_02245 [Candidatus Omnitrophota bacterium]HEC69913.1 helix-hairpin-helix domain-containing protein [Candidatus Omnitrophota bacterium]